MAYNITNDIEITRQEGDTTDIVFIVPAEFPMSVDFEVYFQVKPSRLNSASDPAIIDKATINTGGSGITVTVGAEQRITILLDPADTKTLSGNHRWEMQTISAAGVVTTIARGPFKIVKELIN